jgi:large subunit ribosomal protein L17
MRHKVAGRKLGRSSAHRKALYRNLVTDLLNYEKITTTEAKAKEIRSLAERMITLGKEGGLHSRRQALSFIFDEKVSEKVFNELAPRYAERPGGYTRITKLAPRLGDGAPMVQIELVK